MVLRSGHRLFLVISLSLVGCYADAASDSDASDTGGGDDDDDAGDDDDTSANLPQFGQTFTVIANASDGVDVPRDLEFAPETGLLWVANLGNEAMVIIENAGQASQSVEVRQDRRHEHFMGEVSALAFGVDNFFATSEESPGNPTRDFMGPTLWTADLDIFAVVGQDPDGDLNGSHMDMLHVSPRGMGIAHERDNVYWVFDGNAGNLVRYDFQDDHGPGMHDHTDGIIRRFMGTDVTRVPQVPGHMEYDKRRDLLYVADTGGGRITVLDTTTGTGTGPLTGNKDDCQEYSGVSGADYSTLADGLNQPSGLVLVADTLFVSDHATGEIVAFDLGGDEIGRLQTPARGIMGLALGPDGKLWYVDAVADDVVRIDP